MKLYVASTLEYSGKTLLALGLARIWGEQGVAVGYVKPLGKIPVPEDGGIVDEDASFLARELGLKGPPEATCPVVVTQDLIMAAYRGGDLRLRERVDGAVSAAASACDVLLLGGAANLRDGVFLGLSPLDLIARHGARVLLLDRFEGEKSMDQILWAAGILGEKLLGVVLNRIARSRQAFVDESVRPCLERKGIRVFGSIPADAVLDAVSVGALAARLPASVAGGADRLEVMIERFCVGAMDVDSALRIFRRAPRKAVITGGGRADIQLAALETDTRCLVLTGGVPPDGRILRRAEEKGVPVLVCQEDTMGTVERFESLIGRLRLREADKISRGVDLVRGHVDTARILAALKGTSGPGNG